MPSCRAVCPGRMTNTSDEMLLSEEPDREGCESGIGRNRLGSGSVADCGVSRVQAGRTTFGSGDVIPGRRQGGVGTGYSSDKVLSVPLRAFPNFLFGDKWPVD